MKRCKLCSVEKDDLSFYTTKRGFLHSYCKECTVSKSKRYYQENRRKLNEQRREYQKRWCHDNKDTKLQYSRNWKNTNREKTRQVDREHYARNKKKRLANGRNYYARKLQRSPKWLTEDMKAEITRIYENCPPGYHVDHIIPLQGKDVSGLHVPWNLQYLSASENMSKNNRVA